MLPGICWYPPPGAGARPRSPWSWPSRSWCWRGGSRQRSQPASEDGQDQAWGHPGLRSSQRWLLLSGHSAMKGHIISINSHSEITHQELHLSRILWYLCVEVRCLTEESCLRDKSHAVLLLWAGTAGAAVVTTAALQQQTTAPVHCCGLSWAMQCSIVYYAAILGTNQWESC